MSYFTYENKNIYYSITGDGKPVVLLHGDTASSRMFEPLLPLYENHFTVILIDFLGNGQSDRIESLPADLWFSQARQTIALLEYLKLGKVSLIGTSGGAWVAVNAALERPGLVEKVVADSFDGRTLAENFAEDLRKERAVSKHDPMARQFYEWCQGEDWEAVVDLNTQALTACADAGFPLFHKPLETLEVPILFLGSLQDTMCRKDLEEEYRQMEKLVPDGSVYLFKTGDHPAMATNADMAAKMITDFIDN